jgi:pilus assembly protein CpaF
MSREALHSQLAAAVQVVLHMSRAGVGVRRLAAVAVMGRAGGEVIARPVWDCRVGWLGARAQLGELLEQRAVRPPW